MRTRMLVGLVVAITSLAALAGCNGVVKTWDDRQNTYQQATDMAMRQIADDWDAIWFANRQLRLTKWQTR